MTIIDMKEPSVVNALDILAQNGFSEELLLQCSDSDIGDLASSLISALDALKVKVALRKEREKIQEILRNEEVYKKYIPMVGMIETIFVDDYNKKNLGNCVLVANPGFAVTALHIVSRKIEKMEEVDKSIDDKGKAVAEQSTNNKRKKKKTFRKVEVDVPISQIEVTFPNTHGGVLTYRAKLVASSPSSTDDLALLGPVDSCLPFSPQFANLQTLQKWLPYKPEVNDKILLLSFPSCKGETRFSNEPTTKDNLPWFAKGNVSCFDVVKGHGFATYSSFEGASGSLALHPQPDGGCRALIHLGTYHESEEIPLWHESALSLLNESLFQKACNGYFTLNTGTFLESYFTQPDHDHLSRHLHPQVACVEVKEKIEVLDDLCGPWPGLDDDDTEQDKEEEIGVEHGEGPDCVPCRALKVDVDCLNDRMHERGLQKILKPSKAFGMIFSWDNVLADTMTLRFESWKELALQEGKPLEDDREKQRHIVSMGTENVLKKVLGWVDANSSVNQFKVRLAKIYDGKLSKVRAPREGLKEWLEALATAGVPCAVVSFLDHVTLLAALQRMGLHKYFQAVVTQEDRMDSMAHRFLAAAVKLDRHPSECVVFEDDPRRIAAAHNYSMKAVTLIGTHPVYESTQADLAVSSFSELSVINLQRLFPKKGAELMDLAEKRPPKRKR